MVACCSLGTVVAVGVAVNLGTPQVARATGTWTGPVPIDDTAITSISCTSATFCMAVDGTDDDYLIFNGTSWTSPSLVAYSDDLLSVSCVSSSFCVAVDNDGDIVEYSNSSWSSELLGEGETPSGYPLESVSCVSTSFCAAVNADGYAYTYTGSTWSLVGVEAGVELQSVSCTDAADPECVATDTAGNYVTYNITTADGWSSATSIPGSPTVDSVSCPTTSFCGAVDSTGGALTFDPLTQTWSSVSPVDGTNFLSSVSCADSSFCAAVDSDGNALIYDGAWSSPSDIDGSTALPSVSCPTDTVCVAGDTSGNAFTFDGNLTVFSSITFYGTPDDPYIVVTGNGFGTEPTPQAAGCDSGGYTYGSTGLVLSDNSQLWSAGATGDCIGLYASDFTNTEVAFGVADGYYAPEQYPPLTDGDSYTLTVNGYIYSGTVMFMPSPGVSTTYTCTLSSGTGLPTSANFPVNFSEIPSPSSSLPVGADFSSSYQVVTTIPSSYVSDAQTDGVEDLVIDGMTAEVDATTPDTGAMSPSTNTSQATNLPLVLALGPNTSEWGGASDTIFGTGYATVTWTAATPGTVDFTPSTLVIDVTGVTSSGNVTVSYSCTPPGNVGPIDTTTVVAPSSTPSYQASAFALQSEVTPGSDAGWELEVSNTSMASVTGLSADISASDGGPTPPTFDLGAMAKGGTNCSSTGPGTISCSIGTLAAGDTDDLYPLVETAGLTQDTTISGSAALSSSNAGSQDTALGDIDVAVVPNGALAVASPGVNVKSTTERVSSSVPAKIVLKLPKYKIKHNTASFAGARTDGASSSAPATVSSPAPVALTVENSGDVPQLCPSSSPCEGSIADFQVTGNIADYTNPKYPVTAVITIYFGSTSTSGATTWVQEGNGTVEQLPSCVKGASGYNVPCLKGKQKTVGTSGKRSVEDTVYFVAGPDDPAIGIRA